MNTQWSYSTIPVSVCHQIHACISDIYDMLFIVTHHWHLLWLEDKFPVVNLRCYRITVKMPGTAIVFGNAYSNKGIAAGNSGVIKSH